MLPHADHPFRLVCAHGRLVQRDPNLTHEHPGHFGLSSGRRAERKRLALWSKATCTLASRHPFFIDFYFFQLLLHHASRDLRRIHRDFWSVHRVFRRIENGRSDSITVDKYYCELFGSPRRSADAPRINEDCMTIEHGLIDGFHVTYSWIIMILIRKAKYGVLQFLDITDAKKTTTFGMRIN